MQSLAVPSISSTCFPIASIPYLLRNLIFRLALQKSSSLAFPLIWTLLLLGIGMWRPLCVTLGKGTDSPFLRPQGNTKAKNIWKGKLEVSRLAQGGPSLPATPKAREFPPYFSPQTRRFFSAAHESAPSAGPTGPGPLGSKRNVSTELCWTWRKFKHSEDLQFLSCWT